MDRFAALLEDLGSLIQVPLHPDHKRSCCLNIDGHLHLKIEDDERMSRLLVGSFICDVPPGKFREKIFKELLKENNLFPRIGTFGYCQRNNSLTLISYLPYAGLQGTSLADFLTEFIEKSVAWKRGVETGQFPQRAHRS